MRRKYIKITINKIYFGEGGYKKVLVGRGMGLDV